MTDTFTASNGYRIERGCIIYNRAGDERHRLGGYSQEALREFFRAEEDKRLGRWRWPANPDYVVYAADENGRHYVFNERGHYGAVWNLYATRVEDAGRDGEWSNCALAYVRAHPEPKPWHNAKEGEVWVVKQSGRKEELPVRVRHGHFRYDDDSEDPLTEEGIINARRIWPEGDA